MDVLASGHYSFREQQLQLPQQSRACKVLFVCSISLASTTKKRIPRVAIVYLRVDFAEE
jgi:hypothetical protein